LKKPDVELRKHPLSEVAKVSTELTQRILFHPEPFRVKVQRQRCICRAKSNNKMILCESCDQWFHFNCVDMTEEEAQKAKDWKCGYCAGGPGDGEKQSWVFVRKQASKKARPAIRERLVSETPKALGIDPHGDDEIEKGPVLWEDVVKMARDGGVKINQPEQRRAKKAAKLVEEGGHHLVDEMTAGGLAARGVDGALVDELLNLQLLDDEEDVEEEDQDSE
jgi:hypothetical protein